MDEDAWRSQGKSALLNAGAVREGCYQEYSAKSEAVPFSVGPDAVAGSRRYHYAERTILRASSRGVPTIDPAQHRLMLHGLVDKSLIFTIDDIRRFPSGSHIYFLECSGNAESKALR